MTSDKLNIDRLLAELSAILSEKHEAKVTVRAIEREAQTDIGCEIAS